MPDGSSPLPPADAGAPTDPPVRWSVPDPHGAGPHDFAARRRKIDLLLATALGEDGEYVHEGEMSSYARSYAGDAVGELGDFILTSGLTEAELDRCVEEITRPDQLAGDRSRAMLLRLDEQASGPLLTALARSPDPAVRRFAVEVAGEPRYWPAESFWPVFPLLEAVPQLLDDPDEEVRLAAVQSARWAEVDAALIGRSPPDRDHATMELYRGVLRRLDDPSPGVRTAAARTLGRWAPEAARTALIGRLAREDDPGVRAALEEAAAAAPVDAPAPEVAPAERGARLREHLEAIAAGQVSIEFMVKYSDAHPLRGGTEVLVGTDGAYARDELRPGRGQATVARGQTTPEQLQELAGLLVRVRIWEARPPGYVPAPDEGCITVTVLAGGLETSVREWRNGPATHESLVPVREFLLALTDPDAVAATRCRCEQPPFSYTDFQSEDLGMDARGGEVQIDTCRHCGRRWLKLLLQNEHFTGSGRWWRVPLEAGDAPGLSGARAFVEGREWAYRGGSFYDGRIEKIRAPIRVL